MCPGALTYTAGSGYLRPIAARTGRAVLMSIRDRLGQSTPPEIHAMIAALTGASTGPFTGVGIVGNVGNVGRSRPSADQRHVFVALRQQFQSRILVAVRAEVAVSVLAESLQAAITAADPGLQIPLIVTSESPAARSPGN